MHAQHVLNFTGENVQLSGVHGDAIKCAGVIIGFPCVDMHGNQRIISCPDTGSFSTANRHCLLPVSRLMHHGFKFNYAIPAEAEQHGFGKYTDYGGTIITPDGVTIVMVHHEHTWRLPTFALPETSSKGFACLPCDPNDTFSSHYSANSFAALNSLDPEKACPGGTCQATTNANIGSDTETLAGFSDLVKVAYQSVRPEQRATLTLVEFRRLLGAEHNVSELMLMQHQQQSKRCLSSWLCNQPAHHMYSRKLETKHIESISKSCTKKKPCGCIALSDTAVTKSYCYLWKSTTSRIAICANISENSHAKHACSRWDTCSTVL